MRDFKVNRDVYTTSSYSLYYRLMIMLNGKLVWTFPIWLCKGRCSFLAENSLRTQENLRFRTKIFNIPYQILQSSCWFERNKPKPKGTPLSYFPRTLTNLITQHQECSCLFTFAEIQLLSPSWQENAVGIRQTGMSMTET